MQHLKLSDRDQTQVINQALKTFKTGGLVIYPTETCYGAGVDATNQKAVDKLLSYKSRREGKPLSVAVSNQAMAAQYVKLNSTAKNLYCKFLPGPLTVVSQGRGRVAQGVESETHTLGIRIPDYPLILKLISRLKRPITATSANVSYKKRPYSIPDILKHTSKKQQGLIDLIIDAGSLPKNPPSTVVDTTLADPLILRQGRLLKTQNLKQKTFLSRSPQETSQLAEKLLLKHWFQLLKQPLIFLLIGELGSGKTQFCKGIGKFLQISQPINSPTYTILKEYPYQRYQHQGLFLHLDTWRLQQLEELNQLQLAQQLKPKNVLAVEWAGRSLGPLLELAEKTHSQTIIIKIKTVKNQPRQRKITFSI
jgi:L-threonylcarbamoyladenylate synthase